MELCLLVMISGCSILKQGGESLVAGATPGAKGFGDSLGRGAVIGINRALKDSLDPSLRRIINDFSTSLNEKIDSLSQHAQQQIVSARDSLLSQKLHTQLIALRNDLLGAQTKRQVMAIIDGAQTKIRDEKTKKYMNGIISEGLAAISRQGGALRDDLLGPKTHQAIVNIVDSSMSRIIQRYKNDLSPALNDNVSFIKRNAEKLLAGIGMIALVIIAYVWYQRRRLQKLLGMVTYQIYKTPDQRMYDDLAHRIQDQAQRSNLESSLRDFLKEQGTLHKWQPTRQAVPE